MVVSSETKLVPPPPYSVDSEWLDSKGQINILHKWGKLGSIDADEGMTQ